MDATLAFFLGCAFIAIIWLGHTKISKTGSIWPGKGGGSLDPGEGDDKDRTRE